jgi:GNAT superfamily N-acetyltransferase
VEIVDLRDRRDEELLQQVYDELYLPSFPDPDEREDMSVWKPLLWGERRDGEGVLFRALVAATDLEEREKRRIAGLAFFELYPKSCSGLLSYLAVGPDFRRTGLARALVAIALDTLKADAARLGRPLTAVYAEIHDPEQVSERTDSMDPAERVSFFAKLNSRRVPIQYVQPPLRPGAGRARKLHLIVVPTERDQRRLHGEDVAAFLRDLYGELVEHPEADRDLRRMEEDLHGDPVELEPLNAVPEQPAFWIGSYSVAFHFVTCGEPREPPKASEQFASFERDLFAYSHRDQPPFSSTAIHVSDPCRRVRIEFSRELRYVSEGRTCTLVADSSPQPRDLRLRASKTRFRSGVTVWHLVLTPAEGSNHSRLSEFDLIKLAKLWEGGEAVRGEYSGHDAETCVRFLADGNEWTLRELAATVFSGDFRERTPKAGILQLIVDESERRLWRGVWRALLKAREEPGVDVSMPFRNRTQRRLAEGVGGVIQGLVDFEEIDDQELREVYAAIDLGEDGIQGIHKGTLVHMGISDRPREVGERSFGISPYLLVPHAVLVHNEELLRQASEAAAQATEARRLGELEAALRKMQFSLEQYLSNVFHYPGERHIYERGSLSRGIEVRERELREQLSALRAKWDEKANRRRGIADDVRNGLLLVLSYASFHQAFPGVDDWVLVVGLVALTSVYLVWRWRDRPP